MTSAVSPPPSVFVFDLGGVVIDWNPRNLYRKLFDDPEEMEHFLREIDFHGWNLEQDRGRSYAEGVALLCRDFPHRAELIAAYDARWEESIGGPIEGTLDLLRELRARGHGLAAVTNWSAEKFALVAHRFPVFDWFDPLVVSGREGVCKPEPEIYGLALERGGWSPEECLFIDDSPINVRGAEQVGMRALHFTTPDALRADLERLGVLPPRSAAPRHESTRHAS